MPPESQFVHHHHHHLQHTQIQRGFDSLISELINQSKSKHIYLSSNSEADNGTGKASPTRSMYFMYVKVNDYSQEAAQTVKFVLQTTVYDSS